MPTVPLLNVEKPMKINTKLVDFKLWIPPLLPNPRFYFSVFLFFLTSCSVDRQIVFYVNCTHCPDADLKSYLDYGHVFSYILCSLRFVFIYYSCTLCCSSPPVDHRCAHPCKPCSDMFSPFSAILLTFDLCVFFLFFIYLNKTILCEASSAKYCT